MLVGYNWQMYLTVMKTWWKPEEESINGKIGILKFEWFGKCIHLMEHCFGLFSHSTLSIKIHSKPIFASTVIFKKGLMNFTFPKMPSTFYSIYSKYYCLKFSWTVPHNKDKIKAKLSTLADRFKIICMIKFFMRM
jgi:hypothetical protein